MEAGTLTRRAHFRPLRSKRLLALAGDDRLVEQIRRGNELAFEVAFERHGAGILAFSRHMLGSREEAEDAVQHTFAAAYNDLQRPGERRIALKAWLYTIARNRCLSVLRARREHASELHELPTEGLSEQVERRAELRELLADVRELPEEQRAALLLAEAAGLSHAEVAEVLGCEVAGVKGLVFRARSGLIERRVARDTPCTDIREQLATLRGGALRRNELRYHLRNCPGCSAYRQELRRQRQMLAVALPVTPTFGLKGSVLGAAGLSGSALGGGASAGAVAFGSATVAKVAMVGVLASGSVVAGEAVVDRVTGPAHVTPSPVAQRHDGAAPVATPHSPPVETGGAHGEMISTERSHGLRGAERRAARSRAHKNGNGAAGERGSAQGRKTGHEKRTEKGTGTARGQARERTPNANAQRTRPSTQRKATAPPKPARPAPRADAPATSSEPIVPAPETVPAPVPEVTAPEKSTKRQ